MKKKTYSPELLSGFFGKKYHEVDGVYCKTEDYSIALSYWNDLSTGSKSDFLNSGTPAKHVYELLKSREINPSGTFGKQGRWYAHRPHLINVRRPSASYPYSEMTACRTLKYVNAVLDENFKQIINSMDPIHELKLLV